VHHDERAFGRSGYSFSKLVSAFYRNLVTNSDLPLKMIRDLGICSLVVSFVLIVVYLARYFSHGISIAGWTTTIVLLLFFGGMTLFSIGVLGRYLISIMLEAKKYPSYLIRREDIAQSADRKGEEGDDK
jgi:dolichol-phosphate mannosyltransferase/undecaprenyl-phosphate 4-deoxy-4-formamido-L-arabinose transferase